MIIFTARDAAKKFGALLDAAERGPVSILKSGRPRAVMISARQFDEYEKDRKKAHEEKLVDLIHSSLDLLREGKLGQGQKALALVRRLRLQEEKPGDARAADKLLEERER